MSYQPGTNIPVPGTNGPQLSDIVEDLGFVARGTVLSRTSAQPVSPTNGDAYIVNADVSWGGIENDVAVYVGGWRYLTPEDGWEMWVENERLALRFDATNNRWSAATDPADATDGGTDTYTTAQPLNLRGSECAQVRFLTTNSTTAPTLNGDPLTTPDGSALWAKALGGSHWIERDGPNNRYLVLNPHPSKQVDPIAYTDGLAIGIGHYVMVQDDIPGSQIPDNSGEAKFIKLTAGEDGVGQYNEGLLTTESVSGSSPTITATAVISHAASPMDGQTVRLINTEERFLRAGNAGVVQGSQFGSHGHSASSANASPFIVNESNGNILSDDSGSGTGTRWSVQGVVNDAGGRTTTDAKTQAHNHPVTVTLAGGNETRSRNVGTTYYMRIA